MPDARSRSSLVIAFAAVAFALFAVEIAQQFGRLPVVWPDEPLLAQPAMLLVREGRLATPLLTGAASGVAERSYWFPQGYFLLLAGVFAAVGPALEAMRAVSVAAAAVVIAATYALARVSGVGRTVALGAAGLLALDPVLGRSSLVGRPDAVALALILVALWLGSMRGRSELLGALCAGCAAMVQPYGAIAIAILLGRTVLERRRPIALVVAALPLLAWALYGAQDMPALLDQLRLTLARHAQPWSPGLVVLTVVEQYADPLSPVVPIAWLLGAVGLVGAARADERAKPVLAAFVLASLATVSVQMWHPVYALPFLYIGLAVLLGRLLGARPAQVGIGHGWRRAIAVSLALIATTGLVALDLHQLAERARIVSTVRPSAYAEWTASIARLLPVGSRVLLGGVPDPTWRLLERGDLRLIAMQDEPRSLAHYLDRLAAEVDYVVFASSSIPAAWSDLVAPRRATLVQRVTTDTGQHDTFCPDWEPCGPLIATVYRVVRIAGRP